MPVIETRYRCRIDYQWMGHSTDGGDAVEAKAMKMSYREPSVEIEMFQGGPACFPFIRLEGANRKAVERLAGKVERYINRRNDVKLGDD